MYRSYVGNIVHAMRSSSTCITKLIVILVMLGYDEVKIFVNCG